MQGHRRRRATQRLPTNAIISMKGGTKESEGYPLAGRATLMEILQVTDFKRIKVLAERGGFEPPVPVTQHNCLAGSPVQPLQHLSGRQRIRKSSDMALVL